MPGWEIYIFGSGLAGGRCSLSDKLIRWGGVSGVEPLVEHDGSLSRREIDCEGVVGEGVRKRWTKGFVEGSDDVSTMMSVRRFEDS